MKFYVVTLIIFISIIFLSYFYFKTSVVNENDISELVTRRVSISTFRTKQTEESDNTHKILKEIVDDIHTRHHISFRFYDSINTFKVHDYYEVCPYTNKIIFNNPRLEKLAKIIKLNLKNKNIDAQVEHKHSNIYSYTDKDGSTNRMIIYPYTISIFLTNKSIDNYKSKISDYSLKLLFLIIGIFVSYYFNIISFFVWLYDKRLNTFLNDKFSNILNRLNNKSIHEILHDYLTTLVNKVNWSANKFKILFIFLLLSFVVNVVVLLYGSIYATATHFIDMCVGIIGVKNAIFENIKACPDIILTDTINVSVCHLAILILIGFGLLSSSFDIFSLGITMFLLRKASEARNISGISKHILLDIVIVLVACCWIFIILAIIHKTPFIDFIRLSMLKFTDNPSLYVGQSFLETVKLNPPFFYLFLFIGITVSVPTIVYMSLLILILVLRLIPSKIQSFIAKILERLLREKDKTLKNVLMLAKGTFAIIQPIILKFLITLY